MAFLSPKSGFVYMVLKRGGKNLSEILKPSKGWNHEPDTDSFCDVSVEHEPDEPKPDSFLCKIFYDLLEALTKLQKAHMTHADLKLENLVVDEVEGQPTIMVVGFGHCRKCFLPHTLQVTTVDIMDPEHVSGSRAFNDGIGRDIYTLGLVLIQLLLKGRALYEMMKPVRAPVLLQKWMRAYWKTMPSILDLRGDDEKEVIVNNFWRYLVFCHTNDGFVLKWITEKWKVLGKKLSEFQCNNKQFAADTKLYSLQNGAETECIRANRKMFASETVAVWAILTLIHPISEERTSLEDFAEIVKMPAPSSRCRKPARRGKKTKY